MKIKVFYWLVYEACFIASMILGMAAESWMPDDFLAIVLQAAALAIIPLMIVGPLLQALLDSRFPGWLYVPFSEKRKKALERQKKRDEVAKEKFKELERALLYPFYSLGRKHTMISDFCCDNPKRVKWLKDSKYYVMWRTDVINWARNNISRIKFFNFNDGIFMYIFDSEQGYRDLVNLTEKYNFTPNPNCKVDCCIELNDERLPKDYFEFPGLVWEDEDIDESYFPAEKRRTAAADAFAFGAGVGIGMGLFGGGGGSSSDGGGCAG
ncbi:MAG: hypothetical protein NC102_00245 [Clostridium sp.]|nr:hypothetical protein [Clostridium sp.]